MHSQARVLDDFRAKLERVFLLFALFLAFSWQAGLTHAAYAAEADGKTVLTFGIVPQQSATRMAAVWMPYLHELSAVSGFNLEFATAKDIPTFEACLTVGAYDVAYMNPYHYTVFSKVSGYRAFAHQKGKKLRGLIVVRKDSDITGLDGLNGRTIAFPSPAAFGASVIPRAEMRQRGIDFNPKYVKSHDSVYRAVGAGLVPAGGGVLRTFNTMPASVRDKLKIIYQTQGYTPHAFAVRPDVPAQVEAKILSAMVQLSDQRPDLTQALGMKGIDPGQDSDWNDVRALGLTQSQTEIVHQESGQCRSD